MVVVRYKTQVVINKYSNGVTSPLCPLCEKESGDITHFLPKCRAMKMVRKEDLKWLQQNYIEDAKPPPRSSDEIISTILNGCMYQTDMSERQKECSSLNSDAIAQVRSLGSGAGKIIIITARESSQAANKVTNQISDRIDQEQDPMLHLLHCKGSPL